ncbi:MAG: ChaN family lipoprotein [Thermodesulfobacteriota bacterium]
MNHSRYFTVKNMILTIGAAWLVFAAVSAAVDHDGPVIYDIALESETPLAESIETLAQNRMVLVGELHDDESHHRAQLHVIQALHEAGVPVAIGMEMFTTDRQELLNRWVGGAADPKTFIRAYYEEWNFPWPLYRDILEYAREERIPVVGLNVSREITRQVAMKGFQSLTETQKGLLPEVTCKVDDQYMGFIKQAHGMHAHGDLNFLYFCEAQLVWDKAMVIHALRYLAENPEQVMVVITGKGHARKLGIPAQVRSRSDIPHAVILPQVEGIIEPGRIGVEDADFIMLQ